MNRKFVYLVPIAFVIMVSINSSDNAHRALYETYQGGRRLVTFGGSGKRCSDSGDCGDGTCMAPPRKNLMRCELLDPKYPDSTICYGYCTEDQDLLGCHDLISNGVITSFCADTF